MKTSSISLAVIITCGATTAFVSAGCGERDQDAPIDQRDTAGAEIFNMPNDFPNVATKCVGHGNRVYEQTKNDSGRGNIVIISDPSCGR